MSHAVEDRFVRIKEVLARTGLSRATLYRRIAENKFPAPRKYGAASVWSDAEIRQWHNAVMNGELSVAA